MPTENGTRRSQSNDIIDTAQEDRLRITSSDKNGENDALHQESHNDNKYYDKKDKKKFNRVRFSTNLNYATVVNSVIQKELEKNEEVNPETKNNYQSDAHNNLKTYLIRKNRNFKPHVVDPEIIECPNNSTEKGCNKIHIRWLLTRTINHIVFRILIIFLLLLDLALIVLALIWRDNSNETIDLPIAYSDFIISIIFLIEICMRMFAMTPRVYFSKRYWYNMCDSMFVIVGLALSIVEVTLMSLHNNEDDVRGLGLVSMLRSVRLVKLMRIARIYFEHHSIKRALRQTVRQNKMGYSEGEFNLDLTYVTTKIIATSFPSEGLMSCYRNNIIDVARFLDEKHGIRKYNEHRYWVYNLCSEMFYDETMFHNQVKRVCIPDHNVPTVKQMIDFVAEANEWLEENENNVVVIHCKGGKGRTGTMICILNLYRGIFRDAETSLSYFGDRRTDSRVANKFQGVETASQIRYVTYYEKLMASQGKFQWMPENWVQIKTPDIVSLKLVKICITGINSVGNGNGTDLSITVQHGRSISDILYKAQIHNEYSRIPKSKADSRKLSVNSSNDYCDSNYSKKKDYLEIDMKNCPILSEDVRIKFNCSSSKVKKGYEWCAFYFWFHTSFIEVNSENIFYLKLNREEIDNPHKPKNWSELGGTYPDNFSIEVYLEKPLNAE